MTINSENCRPWKRNYLNNWPSCAAHLVAAPRSTYGQKNVFGEWSQTLCFFSGKQTKCDAQNLCTIPLCAWPGMVCFATYYGFWYLFCINATTAAHKNSSIWHICFSTFFQLIDFKWETFDQKTQNSEKESAKGRHKAVLPGPVSCCSKHERVKMVVVGNFNPLRSPKELCPKHLACWTMILCLQYNHNLPIQMVAIQSCGTFKIMTRTDWKLKKLNVIRGKLTG